MSLLVALTIPDVRWIHYHFFFLFHPIAGLLLAVYYNCCHTWHNIITDKVRDFLTNKSNDLLLDDNMHIMHVNDECTKSDSYDDDDHCARSDRLLATLAKDKHHVSQRRWQSI